MCVSFTRLESDRNLRNFSLKIYETNFTFDDRVVFWYLSSASDNALFCLDLSIHILIKNFFDFALIH